MGSQTKHEKILSSLSDSCSNKFHQGFWQVTEEKSNSRGFQGQIRGKIGQFCGNFAGVFEANFTKKQSLKNGRFCGYFQGKFR